MAEGMGVEALRVPCGRVARGEIEIQGSKAITQRALVLAALADGASTLEGVSPARDVKILADALRALGVTIQKEGPSRLRVQGLGCGFPTTSALTLDAGENGTALRLLTAAAALRHGHTVICGAAHRPVGHLVRALRTLGIAASAAGGDERAPVSVEGGTLRGGDVELPGTVSSQYATALLLIAPCLVHGLRLRLTADSVSASYLATTCAVLADFGVHVESGENGRRFEIPAGQRLIACSLRIDGDASAAAFYLAAAAATGGEVSVRGVGDESIQGDIAIVDILQRMGCRVEMRADRIRVVGGDLQGIDIDLRATPDLVPVVAALAPFARGRTRIAGIGHLRYKESDRLAVLAGGLRQLGARVDAGADRLEIEARPSQPLRGASLDASGDHRMAMAFAILGLRIPGVEIRGSRCVEKSDPDFFPKLLGLLEGDRES